VVADADGNDVLGVSHKKQISTLAVFPAVPVDAPAFLGLPAGSRSRWSRFPRASRFAPRTRTSTSAS
jgi:hypothetical protein